MTNYVTCPTCEGTGNGGRVHVNTGYNPYLKRHDGYWLAKSACIRCEGTGLVPSVVLEWIQHGKTIRKKRIDRAETLVDCAKRLGLKTSELSAIEMGRVEPPQDI